jgi:hypothetical protein
LVDLVLTVMLIGRFGSNSHADWSIWFYLTLVLCSEQ